MKIEALCQGRQVRSQRVATPLLIPSFSSRGFPTLKTMYERLREHTTDSSLVSAYDIHHGNLSPEEIYSSEVLFIDSGGFECGTSDDLSDLYNLSGHKPKPWTAVEHAKVLRELKPLSSLVVVNFDMRGPIDQQIGNARELFNSLPREYMTDFLVKPETKDANYVPISSLGKHWEDLADFDVIGITEKELGSSFLARCKNLVALRRDLSYHDINVPIHIFGGLDPLSVIAYFLCGADVFDGLSWLRLAYRNGIALYYNSYALVEGQWTRTNHQVHVKASLDNLEHLSRTQAIMRTFTRSYDWKDLELPESELRQLQALIRAAGVEYKE